MDYIDSAYRLLLYGDKADAKHMARMAVAFPTTPAVQGIKAMRLYDQWLDSAYVSGRDDAQAGRGIQWDRDAIVYSITGYKVLPYPRMAQYIERMYWQGYSVGMPIG